jgi:hypothetical protein
MFYAAHYLPIAMYDESGFICASGFYEDGDPYPFVLPKLLAMSSPAVYVSSDTGYYGLVNCADSRHCFVLGPAYATPVTDGFIRSYMNKNAIPPERYGEIASYLGGIPQYTFNQFLNLLLYLHFILTGEKKEITDAFGLNASQYHSLVGQQHSESSYQAREVGIQHGTYHFEQQMLELIKNGEPEKLNAFLLAAANTANTREGKLAETPLRQAKNLFIGLVTMVGKFAAIPGGMDIEQTYQLIDTYIQECEKLQTEEAVKNLQYNMPMDFARRVAQQKLPEGVSQEVFSCMQFIATHINDNLGVTNPSGDIFWTDDLHLLPFDGIQDWAGVAHRLDRCGYDGILTFELTRQSKPGRTENDPYMAMEIEAYLKECYARACKLAGMRNEYHN